MTFTLYGDGDGNCPLNHLKAFSGGHGGNGGGGEGGVSGYTQTSIYDAPLCLFDKEFKITQFNGGGGGGGGCSGGGAAEMSGHSGGGGMIRVYLLFFFYLQPYPLHSHRSDIISLYFYKQVVVVVAHVLGDLHCLERLQQRNKLENIIVVTYSCVLSIQS